MRNKPKYSAPQQSYNYPFPPCINKKQSRMVCLNPSCKQYPFFCSNCQSPSCQNPHAHVDKLSSISYKQFTKRVMRGKRPIDKLSTAMQSYRQTLQKLQEDVNTFIYKEMAQLDAINEKIESIPPEDEELIKLLKVQKYEGLSGQLMDQLWTSFGDTPQQVQSQQQTADFITIKEQEVQGISQHFQYLNKMDLQSQLGPKQSNKNTQPGRINFKR